MKQIEVQILQQSYVLTCPDGQEERLLEAVRRVDTADRKSTRLNSSHLVISYAVFCLKKKNEAIDASAGKRSRLVSHRIMASALGVWVFRALGCHGLAIFLHTISHIYSPPLITLFPPD